MAAKRKSSTNPKKARTGSGVRDQPDRERVGLAAPVEVPASGEAASTGPRVSKAGPSARGGRHSAGAGRVQAAAQTRRYAFRRS
jgi:hypothetical protein